MSTVHDERGGHALYYASFLAWVFGGFKQIRCEKCEGRWKWTLDVKSTCPGGKK